MFYSYVIRGGKKSGEVTRRCEGEGFRSNVLALLKLTVLVKTVMLMIVFTSTALKSFFLCKRRNVARDNKNNGIRKATNLPVSF